MPSKWPTAQVEWTVYDDAHPDNVCNVFIQWKGTDACIDFTCECGEGGHYDGYFCYRVKCGACGREWVFPSTIYPAAPDPGGYQHEPVVIETEETEWGGSPLLNAEPDVQRRVLMERLAVVLSSPEALACGVRQIEFDGPTIAGTVAYRPDDKARRIDGVLLEGPPFGTFGEPIELGGKGYETHEDESVNRG